VLSHFNPDTLQQPRVPVTKTLPSLPSTSAHPPPPSSTIAHSFDGVVVSP
jgi:hypothetical protein